MASVDESLAKLAGSQVVSKLDASSGFWQLPLDENSKLLTTFITPFGRFRFNRLPFGINFNAGDFPANHFSHTPKRSWNCLSHG